MNAAALQSELLAYAHNLAALHLCGEGDVIAAREDCAHVLLAGGAPFASLTSEHIVRLGVHDAYAYQDVCALFAARPDVYGLTLLHSPFARAASGMGARMRASLDDTAQIAGGCIRTAPSAASPDVRKALGRNFGCFVQDAGMLTVGRSLHEAYVAALVLEKGARAHVLAKPFGGAKPLSRIDCLLMRRIYLKKYSQIQEREL